MCAPHDPKKGKQLSHPDQNRNNARRDQESVLCALSVTDTRPFQQNVTDAYRWGEASRNTNCDHNDIRQCPHRYNAGKSIDAVEEALAARSFPRKHVVTHHDETLRCEE